MKKGHRQWCQGGGIGNYFVYGSSWEELLPNRREGAEWLFDRILARFSGLLHAKVSHSVLICLWDVCTGSG